jgi:serine/threonine-protein kinase
VPAAGEREPAKPAPRRRWTRRRALGAVAVLLVAAVLAVGFLIGRKTDSTVAPAGRPTTTAPAAPAPADPASPTAGPPAPAR